jgi:hypothetical protein
LPKKTFEQAAANGVHLIAQVKANQPGLHDAIAKHCETAAPRDCTHTTDTKQRCRDELRLIEVFSPGAILAGTEWDEHVQSIIRVTRSVLHRSAATGLWHETSEVALFVADITCRPRSAPKPCASTGYREPLALRA